MSNSAVKVDHQQEMIKLIQQLSYKLDITEVFKDFLELSAICISNGVDYVHREEREKRYLDRINSYEKPQQAIFPKLLFHLVEALEEKTQTTGAEDIFTTIFMELKLAREEKAQYFTPQSVSELMARIIGGNNFKEDIEERGYVSALEPACGSGGSLMALCKQMAENDLNYCSQLVIMAVDIDLKCCFMTYLQLALYGVPAVVIHGNSLTCEEWSRWYTPVYIVNGWVWRESFSLNGRRNRDDELLKCALEPMYAALMNVEALIAATPQPKNISPVLPATATGETKPDDRKQIHLGGGSEVPRPDKKPRPKTIRPAIEPVIAEEQLDLFSLT